MFKGWDLMFSITGPGDDWLLGLEYSPDNIVIREDEEEHKVCSIFSLGLIFFRFDIIIPFINNNKKQ